MHMNTTLEQPVPDFQTIKARQKATWESGDFGQVAKFIMVDAEQFMARIDLTVSIKFRFSRLVRFFTKFEDQFNGIGRLI